MPIAKQHERGAFLVIIVLILVVLLGIGSLALDIGRVLVLRTEMQNAADAAALAAAVELDSNDNAMDRAKDAARHTLDHNSHFARVSTLLGENGLPDEAFTFFCAIGSPHDESSFCSGDPLASESEKIVVSPGMDVEAHYVRITLDEAISNSNQFTTDLIFLPLLKLLEVSTLEAVSLKVSALAGRSFYACDYPPMAICDPFESSGTTFKDAMPVGGHIELKQQGSNQWVGGNFGFLEPYSGGPGASDVALFLADEGLMGCTPPVVTTKTGGMTQKTKSAINTRFDIYEPPNPFNKPDAPDNWPPAPSVTQYTLDQTTLPTDSRFGTGDWDYAAYKQQLTNAIPAAVPPAEWDLSRPTRWTVYNWEISSGNILTRPDPSHIYNGDYPPPQSVAERRMFYTAVLSCNALGLTGGKATATISGHDGFAKIFIIKQAEGPPNSTIYGEFIGWGNETDGQYHVDVQLYE